MIQWEFRESCTLNEWLEVAQLRWPGLRGFHVANENPGRNKAERARIGALRRRMGVKSGVCDWFFFCPPDVRIAIELKKPLSAGKAYPSAEEREWLAFFAQCGFATCVAHGAPEAIDFVVAELNKNGAGGESAPLDDSPF